MVNYSYSGKDNGTGLFHYYDYDYFQEYNTYHPYFYILYRFSISNFIFGIFGNGMVIWFLCFRIKRNYFTPYILNLAIANVGFLVNLTSYTISYILFALHLVNYHIGFFISFYLLHSFMSCSSLSLTIISIDRCVSVFFPIWHQRCWPANLSGFVCVLIWLLAFLPYIIWFIRSNTGVLMKYSEMYYLIVNVFCCLPLMTISNLLLSIKACCKSQPQRREKLLKTILVTIFFFLFYSIPLIISYLLMHVFNVGFIFYFSATFCACLNSIVSPLIYCLVGRPKKEHSNESMEAILKDLFKRRNLTTSTQNQAETPV